MINIIYLIDLDDATLDGTVNKNRCNILPSKNNNINDYIKSYNKDKNCVGKKYRWS